MKELFSTVTTKGQVTIPIEVRRRLGLTVHEIDDKNQVTEILDIRLPSSCPMV